MSHKTQEKPQFISGVCFLASALGQLPPLQPGCGAVRGAEVQQVQPDLIFNCDFDLDLVGLCLIHNAASCETYFTIILHYLFFYCLFSTTTTKAVNSR